MTSVFGRLLDAYRRRGYQIRTGLNPLYFDDADAPFTHLFTDRGIKVGMGAGLAIQELYFLESLCTAAFQPRHVFIIGNAFGWSALALAMIIPDARVVAIDAAIEGEAAAGTQLTHTIAADEGVDVRVVNALSPRDVASVIAEQFGEASPDLVLIDGFHENRQLMRDFNAVSKHASPQCVYLCHDVLHWHLLEGFDSLRIPCGYERRILTRCPSGMGIVFPSTLAPSVRRTIEAFIDDTIDLAAWHAAAGASHSDPGPRLQRRLARGWKLRHLGTAAICEAEGDIDRAQDLLARIDEENHADVEVQIALACHYIDRFEWTRAEPLLIRARQMAPAWEFPVHQLGRVLREKGECGAARECQREAVRLNPSWAPPHLELGVIARTQHDEDEAEAHFQAAADLDPQWTAPLLQAGVLLFERQDLVGARDLMNRVLAIAPDALALHVLGLIARASDGPAAAIPWLERAVAHNSDCAEPWFDLGTCRRDTGDDTGAIAAFDRALQSKPGWAACYIEAGRCLIRLQRWNAAAQRLSRASELEHLEYDGWRQLANSWQMIGRWNRALDALHVAGQISSNVPPLDKEVAACLRALGKSQEAVDVLKAAVRRRPDWAGAHFELGRLCESLEQPQQAFVHYTHAAQMRPTWQEAQQAVARLRTRFAA